MKIKSHTMLRRPALSSLNDACRIVRRKNIEGDFVQCGVWKGGSAALMALSSKPSRHLWLFDSWSAKLPEPSTKDQRDPKTFKGDLVATPDDVHEVMSKMEVLPSRYTIRKGWFNDTFKESLPDKVALLHCDCDFYESVLLTLETFYPRISKGGIIILDDYNAWIGCREAFFEFCFKYNLRPKLVSTARSPRQFKWPCLIWVKD